MADKELKKLKHTQVVFEGPNRAGKTTTKRAFEELTKWKYITIDRGLMTGYVMTRIFNRDLIDYDLEQFRDVVFVYLTADVKDIEERYRLTDHEEFPMIEEMKLFDEIERKLISEGFHILRFNTSRLSSNEIALQIQEYIERLNK